MTRNEAIKWLERIEERYIHGGDEAFDGARKEALHMAIEALKRQHGEWIYLYEDNYKCSICGSWWCCIDDSQMDEMNYCPNCGSDMRGDEDDN